jgi:hypothetical protein
MRDLPPHFRGATSELFMCVIFQPMAVLATTNIRRPVTAARADVRELETGDERGHEPSNVDLLGARSSTAQPAAMRSQPFSSSFSLLCRIARHISA